MNYPRNGLRIRTESGVHPEVKRACLEFAKWLRTEYNFPIRVVVYLKRDYQIKNRYTKELVSATFFAPYDKNEEPYIRVATGDYLEMVDDRGQDNTLAAILGSIVHELGHYYQWLDDQELDEEGADECREEIIEEYESTREHP
ncbi:hypothetical protein Back11_19320 [Paenibacillus baekrokdamisoli]|uniref:Uncharacterized protein n=1 Tax=Paenibacillus baekrokdamisoli TaxID=1712516 RepID=A0A3G9INZ0_9BACL|nr:hypothetical protein [Paenibacillus baekrokdamisoli]BBH20587.1 hypothetical protein Back11_19320 [Paenibacillus baekrokdamisoli]